MGESKAASLVIANAVMLFLTTISSAVRLWVRVVYMKGLGSDDSEDTPVFPQFQVLTDHINSLFHAELCTIHPVL